MTVNVDAVQLAFDMLEREINMTMALIHTEIYTAAEGRARMDHLLGELRSLREHVVAELGLGEQ